MQSITGGSSVPPNVVIAMAGIAKVYVGEIVEEGNYWRWLEVAYLGVFQAPWGWGEGMPKTVWSWLIMCIFFLLEILNVGTVNNLGTPWEMDVWLCCCGPCSVQSIMKCFVCNFSMWRGRTMQWACANSTQTHQGGLQKTQAEKNGPKY
jgi:hypothetical protein